MVAQDKLSEEPNLNNSSLATTDNKHIEEWPDDVSSISSISSKGSHNDEDNQSASGLEIAVPDDCVGNFGNVIVKNSSDVQFGNNTYFQGAVTIKQFVYSGVDDKPLCIDDGKTNLAFISSNCDITDNVIKSGVSDKNCSNVNKDPNSNSAFCKDVVWLNYAYNKRKYLTICIVLLLITTLISTITVLLIKKHQNNSNPHRYPDDSDEQDSDSPIDPPIDPNVNITLPNKLKIVPRVQWVAQPPTEPANNLTLPVPYVIILHTATESCMDQGACVLHVREIQNFHMESRGWWDIGYNFLVGGDGFAYEGRGWKAEGAHTYGYNARSIGIGFIGTFIKYLPPSSQIKAAKQLIEMGVKKGYIMENYKLLAHRQLTSTQSPGEALYENMKTWPHWSKSP